MRHPQDTPFDDLPALPPKAQPAPKKDDKAEQVKAFEAKDWLPPGLKEKPKIVHEWGIVSTNCYNGHHTEVFGDRWFFDGCDDEGYESIEDAEEALAAFMQKKLP